MKKVKSLVSSISLKDHRTEFLRRSEHYINGMRFFHLSLMSVLMVIRSVLSKGPYVGSDLFWNHLVSLGIGWFFALGVMTMLKTGFTPRWLPWVAGLSDLLLVTNGLVTSAFTAQLTFPTDSILSSSYYGVYYIVIIFSVLRLNPGLSVFLAVTAAVFYSYAAFVLGRPVEPPAFFAANEGSKVLFLFLAGLATAFVAKFTARIISEMVDTQRRAIRSDQQLSHLSAHLPGVVLQFRRSVDRHWTMLYTSQSLEDYLPLDPIKMAQQPDLIPEAFRLDTRKNLLDFLEAEFSQDSTITLELCLANPKPGRGSWFRVGISALPEKDGGVLYNALVLDITEQKVAEEGIRDAMNDARQANEAKATFLANMSHELRTPLNAIIGLTEWLLLQDPPAASRAPLQNIGKSADNLLEVISDILDFSRLEAGKLSVVKKDFDLGGLLEELQIFFHHNFKEKNLDLEVKMAPDIPKVIITDPKRIRQILVNLMENAYRYTFEGRVVVSARVKTLDGNGSLVVVEVEDTGLGIPEKDQQRIFETFTQVENSKTRLFGGAGLGLAISRRLAELLDGSLSVRSQPGMGSVFTLQFPLVVQRRKEQRAQVLELEAPEVLEPRRILMVEDNEVNQDVQKRLLEKLGMRVDCVSSGIEALDVLKIRPYDLVFIDWQMPVLDGIETARRIRQEVPGGRDLPLVALSGHAFPADRTQLLEAGFNSYLAKPVRLADFRRVLKEKSLEPALRGL